MGMNRLLTTFSFPPILDFPFCLFTWGWLLHTVGLPGPEVRKETCTSGQEAGTPTALRWHMLNSSQFPKKPLCKEHRTHHV